MNWDRVKGQWNQVAGTAKQKWGKLTDDDFKQIGGVRDKLVGKLQEKYGMARDAAEKEADNFFETSGEEKQSQQQLP
jgi:uncharacterized protein YjbJ (UPF0337 family)